MHSTRTTNWVRASQRGWDEQSQLRLKVRNPLRKASSRIADTRAARDSWLQRFNESRTPWIYVIVATGNIYEDVKQAEIAANQGADVIAVIRSTAQSLLDFVPEGATTEGFAGT